MNSNGVCDHFHETQANFILKQNNPEKCNENPVLRDEPPICKPEPESLQLSFKFGDFWLEIHQSVLYKKKKNNKIFFVFIGYQLHRKCV